MNRFAVSKIVEFYEHITYSIKITIAIIFIFTFLRPFFHFSITFICCAHIQSLIWIHFPPPLCIYPHEIAMKWEIFEYSASFTFCNFNWNKINKCTETWNIIHEMLETSEQLNPQNSMAKLITSWLHAHGFKWTKNPQQYELSSEEISRTSEMFN